MSLPFDHIITILEIYPKKTGKKLKETNHIFIYSSKKKNWN